MTTVTPLGWRLSAAQWDVLTEALQLDGCPAPIQARSPGRADLDGARTRAEAVGELTRLGLLRASRVDADLEAALHLLHRPARWLDSVWLPDAAADQPVRVLAARRGTVGVCALQHPDQPGSTILDVIPGADPVAAVIVRLPAHPPGRGAAVTIAVAPGSDRRAQPAGAVLVSASPTRTGAERDAAAASAILGQPHTRAGQIAATVRDPDGQLHRSPILRWCDNPDGRYQITLNNRSAGTRSLRITPCDPDHLRAALHHLLDTLD